ncbi:MAG: hypothetical protein JWM55_819 [Acidimicrobiaceae bacterium]|nr:hypothetical protein [Acidimicrobiaceae bacterium]
MSHLVICDSREVTDALGRRQFFSTDAGPPQLATLRSLSRVEDTLSPSTGPT